jgi:hypothetical protein
MRRAPFRSLAARSLVLLATLAAATLPLVNPGAPPAPRVRGGPPPPRPWQRDCAAKPFPPVGGLVLTIVDRPARDTAVVRADWSQGPLAEKGPVSLTVLLPDGAFLVEGVAEKRLPERLVHGADAWVIRFPTDRTSDLAVRLRVDTENGPETREFPLRLWETE